MPRAQQLANVDAAEDAPPLSSHETNILETYDCLFAQFVVATEKASNEYTRKLGRFPVLNPWWWWRLGRSCREFAKIPNTLKQTYGGAEAVLSALRRLEPNDLDQVAEANALNLKEIRKRRSMYGLLPKAAVLVGVVRSAAALAKSFMGEQHWSALAEQFRFGAIRLGALDLFGPMCLAGIAFYLVILLPALFRMLRLVDAFGDLVNLARVSPPKSAAPVVRRPIGGPTTS